MDLQISPIKFYSSGGAEPIELEAGTARSCDHVIRVSFVLKPTFKPGCV